MRTSHPNFRLYTCRFHPVTCIADKSKWVPKTDEAITADLKNRLELMFVNDTENVVSFKVSNGVAIMEGSVETWYLWQNALDEALAAGAREPHMMIEVRNGTPASLRYSGPHDYVPQCTTIESNG